jgi:hypothetical protein
MLALENATHIDQLKRGTPCNKFVGYFVRKIIVDICPSQSVLFSLANFVNSPLMILLVDSTYPFPCGLI